jgi:hypothetical protein
MGGELGRRAILIENLEEQEKPANTPIKVEKDLEKKFPLEKPVNELNDNPNPK